MMILGLSLSCSRSAFGSERKYQRISFYFWDQGRNPPLGSIEPTARFMSDIELHVAHHDRGSKTPHVLRFDPKKS